MSLEFSREAERETGGEGETAAGERGRKGWPVEEKRKKKGKSFFFLGLDDFFFTSSLSV